MRHMAARLLAWAVQLVLYLPMSLHRKAAIAWWAGGAIYRLEEGETA